MKYRPWPIVFLAIIHWLAPLGNWLFSAWVQKLPPILFLKVLLATESPWGLIDFFLIFPIAGVAVYLCKRWSYPIFIAIALFTVFGNYMNWREMPDQFPFWFLIVSLFLDVIFVGYFLMPAVRMMYIDPRMRWWESKPRYTVNWAAQFEDKMAEKHACKILDFSVGGVLLEYPGEMYAGDLITLNVPTHEGNPHALAVKGHVVYRKTAPTLSYGIQFAPDKTHKHTLKLIVKHLKNSNAVNRNAVDYKAEFTLWIKTLLTTGKGLVPELPKKKA